MIHLLDSSCRVCYAISRHTAVPSWERMY